jgi:hypothetical protein
VARGSARGEKIEQSINICEYKRNNAQHYILVPKDSPCYLLYILYSMCLLLRGCNLSSATSDIANNMFKFLNAAKALGIPLK